jgi:hypothetical protein
VSLRIACDLDGTVADMDAALLREAIRLFGPGISLGPGSGHEAPEAVTAPTAGASGSDEADAPSARTLTRREVEALWEHVRQLENFWNTLDEIEEGTVRRFAQLASDHRWHVVFMTRRPPTRGENAQLQSQRWLSERGFPFPSVCIVSHSRGKLAGLLDMHAVIDDRPATCLDVVADSKAEAILVWRGDPKAVPKGVTGLGVKAVPTFSAALDRLEARATGGRGRRWANRISAALRGE